MRSRLLLPAAFAKVGELVKSLKEYPTRTTSLDFNIDDALKALNPKGN